MKRYINPFVAADNKHVVMTFDGLQIGVIQARRRLCLFVWNPQTGKFSMRNARVARLRKLADMFLRAAELKNAP